MKVVVADKYKAYTHFISRIPVMMEGNEGQLLFKKRNTVKLFTYNGHQFVVKQYKRPYLFQRVVYTFFRPTKTERAFKYAAEYRRRGISTPQEIAYIECKKWGIFTTGYFVSEPAVGNSVFDFVLPFPIYDKDLIKAVIGVIVKMHTNGIFHGDLNTANFLFTKNGELDYDITVIDLNRSHLYNKPLTRNQCLEDLKRFTHRPDLYRFAMTYYAELRHWCQEEFVADALIRLQRFEHRKFKIK